MIFFKEFNITDTWIISDGTAGMEKQSIALAILLKKNYEIIKINPPYLLKLIPILGKFCFSGISQKLINNKKIPNYVITCGKRMAGLSILLKSTLKDKIKTIHIQNPKLPSNFFDLVIIPEHDKVKGLNIIQTKGALSFFSYSQLKNDYGYLKKNNTNIVLLMVGGKNKRYTPQSIDYLNLSLKVIEAIKKINAKLLVSVSRRTSKKAMRILDESFSKNLKNYQMLSISDKNPYPDILKISDYIIVTSDSVNMISETASLSIPLFVYNFPKESGKITIFLNDLENLGIIKFFQNSIFKYKKQKLKTNKITISKVNKFLGI